MNQRRHVFSTVLIVCLLLVATINRAGVSANPAAISQPTQPASGPGSREHRFTDTQRIHVGDEPTGAWVVTPAGVTPSDLRNLPTVLFIHGFGARDPNTYGGWIDHLVLRGAIVIYPDYQPANPLQDAPAEYISNLFTGIRTGIEHLEHAGMTDVRTRGLHVVGHSLGGVLAVRYAQDADRLGFPRVRTLTVVEPGGCSTCGNFGSLGVPLELDRMLPADLLAQMVVGSDDSTVGDADARSIWPLLRNIPSVHRDYVTIVSDHHGAPPMIADHEMVGTGGARGIEDAMDWFALWRPLDALIACVDSGKLCSTAIGDTSEHRAMGTWSDGTPVTPLLISDGPR